jgi:hypothetical protein
MTCCVLRLLEPTRAVRERAAAARRAPAPPAFLGLAPVCLALVAACLAALPATSAAQAPAHRVFPATALRGELVLGTLPEASLNGAPARLAPGARIRGADNLLQVPVSVAGQRLLVHYTLEPTTGLVLDVWILNPTERARQPWPATPEQARAWRFDPSAQTWTRP